MSAAQVRCPGGFTLIELITALAILALLASVAMPFADMAIQRKKEDELRHSLRVIRDAIDEYSRAVQDGRIQRTVGSNGYPKTLKLLVDGVEDQQSPTKSKLYFLRRIPRDPFGPETGSAEESWGKRSYASSADDPREGEDVYDVYSRSEKVGLNGIPYRQW
ncbi:MAG TPA: type II secretion system protein [Rhodocyclaceae bacterium]|nr:type II secretion system protein [Rhodocyclaceae bacterium]